MIGKWFAGMWFPSAPCSRDQQCMWQSRCRPPTDSCSCWYRGLHKKHDDPSPQNWRNFFHQCVYTVYLDLQKSPGKNILPKWRFIKSGKKQITLNQPQYRISSLDLKSLPCLPWWATWRRRRAAGYSWVPCPERTNHLGFRSSES